MTSRPAVPFVLGSSSPRRLALLRQIGFVPHDVRAPDIDETPLEGELPRAYASRLALEKAQAVHAAAAGSVVLAADTVVACGRRILPKPEAGETEIARACLERLSGRRHRVLGGLTVIDASGRARSRLVTTIVHVARLTTKEIDAYLATGDWHGKAGGYAIQGRAAAFVPCIRGSCSNVVGLPLTEATHLLEQAGCRRTPDEPR
ncbi:MAG: septum formation protein Maf [Geminicoccaceae bacterium]|nr:septum formation protein Maf [Geminicoccaceae bacterium]